MLRPPSHRNYMELYIKKGKEKLVAKLLKGRDYKDLSSDEKKKLGKLRDLSGLKEEFLDYCLKPGKKQKQEDWAKERFLSPITVSLWKRDEEFKKEKEARLQEYLGDSTREVYRSLIKKAKEGDVNAIRLFLQQAAMLKSEDGKTGAGLNITFVNAVPRSTKPKQLKQTGENSFEVEVEDEE